MPQEADEAWQGVAPGEAVRMTMDEDKPKKKGISEDSAAAQRLKGFLPQILNALFAAEKVIEQGIAVATNVKRMCAFCAACVHTVKN